MSFSGAEHVADKFRTTFKLNDNSGFEGISNLRCVLRAWHQNTGIQRDGDDFDVGTGDGR